MEPDWGARRRRLVHRAPTAPRRLLAGVLVAGAAAAAALPGTVAGAQEQGGGGVRLEASAGFAGRYLVGRRLPVTVEITADRLVRGTVEVQVDGLPGTWAVPVEVPGGSSKEVVVVVPTPAGLFVREVDVTLRDGGDEVAGAQPEVEALAEDELVGLLPGVTPADLPEPVALPGEIGTARFVRIDLELLDVPGLLDPIGTVVAGADEVGRLDAAGRAELLTWTDRGGRLVVDSTPSATVAGLPDDWQPDGEARRVAGLGEVRSSSGRAAAGDWAAVVEPTPTVSNQELAAFGWWGSGESLSDSLARDAGLDALDLPWLAAFVIVYIALCGPVAYVALRGRRNLGWVVVPGLAVVFTGAAFVVGSDLRAGTTTSHGTVLEVGSAGTRATTVVGAVSRSGADGEATFPAGWTVSPLDSSALGLDAGGPIAITTTPDGAQAAIPLAAGDFGVARGSGAVPGGEDGALVTVEATSEDGTVTGTVTNDSDLHLERVGVFLGRAGTHVDSIDPGDTATFSFPAGGEFSRGDPYAPAEAQVWPAESGYGIEFDPRRNAESIVNLALLQDHLAPLGPNARPRGVVTVVGWTRDLDSPADIRGPGRPEGRSIVIARAPVTSADGSVVQGSARRELLRGPNGVELPDDEVVGISMDGYIWRFTLPDGADASGGLRVSVPGYVARIDAWDGERWVTVDRRSGQFLGDLSAQRLVDLPPELLVDGRVLVRGFGTSDFGPTMAEGIDVYEAAT